jgi:hypothetical protein
MKNIPTSGDIAVERTTSDSVVDNYKRIRWSSTLGDFVSDNFRGDVERYMLMENKSWIYAVLNRQGLWALAEYRFSRWVCSKLPVPVIRHLQA